MINNDVLHLNFNFFNEFTRKQVALISAIALSAIGIIAGLFAYGVLSKSITACIVLVAGFSIRWISQNRHRQPNLLINNNNQIVNVPTNRHSTAYNCTQRIVKYFEETSVDFEKEADLLDQRVSNMLIHSKNRLEHDLSLFANKAERFASTYYAKLKPLIDVHHDDSEQLDWDKLFIEGVKTYTKMNDIVQRCKAWKKKVEFEYPNRASAILPTLYQEIEKNEKKLQSDINKIQPKDEISLANYKSLKTRAAEMDRKIRRLIEIVNDLSKRFAKDKKFQSENYTVTLDQIVKRISSEKSESRFNFFAFFNSSEEANKLKANFSNNLEVKFSALKKKPLEIDDNFTLSGLTVNMDHLKKAVIGLEIPEAPSTDLKKKYKEIYNQCAHLIPEQIADDNQLLNLNAPQPKQPDSHGQRPSVIDNFDINLENLIKMHSSNFTNKQFYILHLERKKLLIHIAMAFESRKKEIDKIKDQVEKKKQLDTYKNDLAMVWMELAMSTFHCIDRQVNIPLSIYNAHVAPHQALPEKALGLDNQVARQLLILRRQIFETILTKMALSWSPDFSQNFDAHRASTERLVRKRLNEELGLQYPINLFVGYSCEDYAEHSQIEAVRQEWYRKYHVKAICEHIKKVLMDNRKEKKNISLNFDRIYEWFKKGYPNTDLNPILTEDAMDIAPQAIVLFLRSLNILSEVNE